MATHSSVLAWRIPGTVEPDGLPSVGSHRVRHDGSDLAEHHVLISHLYIFFGETSIQNLCPFFNQNGFVLLLLLSISDFL